MSNCENKFVNLLIHTKFSLFLSVRESKDGTSYKAAQETIQNSV